MQTKNHNLHLDGLRGIAILMVIFFHYFTGFYIFDFGWSGVDLFFILSGYLLSGRIIPYLADKKIIWKFYVNRLLRIVPLYFSFLIIFYLLFYFISSNETQNFSEQLKRPIIFFTFLCNWMFIANYNPVQHQLSHLWSLAVEEQFYLIFPIYIFVIKKNNLILKTTLILILSIFFLRSINCFFVNDNEILKIYWNSFYRMDSFLTGLIIYLLKENGFLDRNLKWIKLIFVFSTISILIGCYVENTFRINYFFITIGFTIVALACGCILIFTLNEKDNYFKKITSNKSLIFLGKISFGLYIFHWPIYLTMFSVTNFLIRKLGFILSANNAQLINIVISFIVATIISLISFKYYESIFLKWKFKLQIP